MWFVTNNTDSDSIDGEIYNDFLKPLCRTDCKSSFKVINCSVVAKEESSCTEVMEYITFIRTESSTCVTTTEIYVLLAGCEVRLVKNRDRGLENAARGHRPRAAFEALVTVFHYRQRSKPENNMNNFFFVYATFSLN